MPVTDLTPRAEQADRNAREQLTRATEGLEAANRTLASTGGTDVASIAYAGSMAAVAVGNILAALAWKLENREDEA